MKVLKWILIVIGALVAIFLIAGLFVPKEYSVERSITINAPKEKVFDNINDLKSINKWSPWKDYDPNMKLSYEGKDGEVGSKFSWEGNDEVGKGSQEITKISNNRIDTKVSFIEPMESETNSFIEVSEESQGTKVVWGFNGVNPYPWNTMCLIMDMDKMLGKEFDRGLGKLKALSE